MFCVYCGKEIPDDSTFCPECGKKQPTAESDGEKIGDIIDKAGEKIGGEIDDAVKDFNTEAREFKESVSQRVDAVGDKVDDVKQNWRDYLTPENMELLAVGVLVLPLFMYIVSSVLSFVSFKIIYAVLRTRFVFKLLKFILTIIRLVFVAVAAAGVASAAYILVQNPSKRNVWSYITAGGTVLSFLACIAVMLSGKGWRVVVYIFGLLCLGWGICAISRVLLQKKGIDAPADPATDLGAYKSWYEEYKAAHPTPSPEEVKTMEANLEASYFDGDGFTLWGIRLLTGIVSLVTCGIAAPWMICVAYRWRIDHTVINGKRLKFNGTGGSLFGHWLLWELLCIVTCGIYIFFLHVALKKWELQHTNYDGQPEAVGQFDGNSLQYFGYGLLECLLLLVTCGLAAPWTITMIHNWETKHTVIGQDRLRYDGTALGLLGQYIVVFLLTIINCGIYSPWATVRINKYAISHTNVDLTKVAE